MRRRWFGMLALLLGGAATAQQPVTAPEFFNLKTAAAIEPAAPLPTPTPAPTPAPATGPTSYGWPQPTAPQPPLPPTVLETAPTGFAALPPGGPYLLDAEGMTPLPGSLEENLNREAAARRSFRYCTWNDRRITLFPGSLLWTPPLAEKRAARMSATATDFDRYGKNYTVDSSMGMTTGLLRVDTPGHDVAYQFDFFAVAHLRTTPQDLIVADYRFGIPLTWQWGDWHGKLAYERTQSHLGDDYLRNTGLPPAAKFVRNEVVAGLDRNFDGLRIYGTVSYAFSQEGMPDPTKKLRFDGGFEYVMPCATGFSGSPFVACHVDAREVTGYNPNAVAQVGWLWRNPFQRLANVRVYAEYYKGRSQFGQFQYDREKFYGVGIAGDF